MPDGGVGNSFEVYFPVDPMHALVMANAPGREEVVDASEEDAAQINLLVAHVAYKWIYHRPNHDPLEKIDLQARGPLVRSGVSPQR